MPRAKGRKIARKKKVARKLRKGYKRVTPEIRAAMVKLVDAGHQQQFVADVFNRDQSTVSRVCRSVSVGICRKRQLPVGRPNALTPRNVRELKRIAIRSPFSSYSAYLAELGPTISGEVTPHTIGNYLRGAGINCYTCAKKPALTERHARARMDWARRHLNWTQEQWRGVLFSDETTMSLRGNTNRKKVHARAGQKLSRKHVVPTEKFSKKVMFWGCFSYHGLGVLRRVVGSMNQESYLGVLRDALPVARESFFCGQRFVFQQDNARCHTTASVTAWISRNDIELMGWPAQSPDINPIENLWALLKSRTYEHGPFKSEEELVRRALYSWNQLGPNEIHRLIDSMPARCAAVIEAGGWHTKY